MPLDEKKLKELITQELSEAGFLDRLKSAIGIGTKSSITAGDMIKKQNQDYEDFKKSLSLMSTQKGQLDLPLDKKLSQKPLSSLDLEEKYFDLMIKHGRLTAAEQRQLKDLQNDLRPDIRKSIEKKAEIFRKTQKPAVAPPAPEFDFSAKPQPVPDEEEDTGRPVKVKIKKEPVQKKKEEPKKKAQNKPSKPKKQSAASIEREKEQLLTKYINGTITPEETQRFKELAQQIETSESISYNKIYENWQRFTKG